MVAAIYTVISNIFLAAAPVFVTLKIGGVAVFLAIPVVAAFLIGAIVTVARIVRAKRHGDL